MYCPNCGSDTGDGNKFCVACGKDLTAQKWDVLSGASVDAPAQGARKSDAVETTWKGQIQCAVQAEDCKRFPVAYVCHHCGRPLCSNGGDPKNVGRKGREKLCYLVLEHAEFPVKDARFEKDADLGQSPAYHCPDCAATHRK